MYTYESQNTQHRFFAYSLFQILQILKAPLFIPISIQIKTIIQTIIQTDKHKAQYIITACIPKVTIKIFLFFIKKNFTTQLYEKKILLNIRMVNQGLNLSLNELRLIAEHRNISDYENKSAKDLIKALRGSRPRLGIKKIS